MDLFSYQVSEAASAPVQSAHPSVIQTYMSTFFRLDTIASYTQIFFLKKMY